MHASLSESRWSTSFEQTGRESLHYSQAWLDLIREIYGYGVIPLTTTDADGHLTGFLSLCSLQTPLRGQRLVALPFVDHCPLLARDEATANALIDQAIHLAQARGARYLELRTGIDQALAKRSDLVATNLYVRWLLPLEADPDHMWSALRQPVQRRIKKSRKLGVHVRLAQTQEDLDRYYQVHLRTRSKKLGMPTQPRQFFRGLWDAFSAQGTMQLLLAEYEGALVAGLILLTSGRTVKCAYSASDERYLHLAPNNLLFWTAITWGCAHGFEVLDFGRTARDNHGLMEFKRRWGAIEEPLPYYYHPRVAGLAATSERSWAFRTLTACWKRLPLPVAQTLGGYLYKHLG